MTEWFATRVLLEANIRDWPKSRPGFHAYAKRRGWKRRDGTGRGRWNFEYLLTDLTAQELAALLAFKQLPAAPADQNANAGTAISAAVPEGAMPSPIVDGAAGAIVAPEREVALPGTPEYEAVRAGIWSEFEAKRQLVKAEAAKRAASAARAIDLIESGVPIMESYRRAAAEFSVSPNSVEFWLQKVGGFKNPKYDRSDFAAVLIDRRGGRPRPYSHDELLYQSYKSDVLRADRPPRMACYRRAVLAAKHRGAPDELIPTEPTLWRRLEKEVPWQSRLYARKGAQALHRTYPAQRRDRSCLYAGQAVNGDGYRFNVAALWPDGEICGR